MMQKKSDNLEASDQYRVPVAAVMYGTQKHHDMPLPSAWEWGGLVALKMRDVYSVSTTLMLAQLCCMFSGFLLTIGVIMGFFFALDSFFNAEDGTVPSWMMPSIYVVIILGGIALCCLLHWYKRKKVAERLRATTENDLTAMFERVGWRIEYDSSSKDSCIQRYFGQGTYVFSRSLEAPEKQQPTTITEPVTVDVIPSVSGFGLHLLFQKHTTLPVGLLWILGGISEQITRNHGMPTLTSRANMMRAVPFWLWLAVLFFLPEDLADHWFLLSIFAILFLLPSLIGQIFQKIVDDSGTLERAFEEISPLLMERSGCTVEYKVEKRIVPWLTSRRLIFTPVSTQEEGGSAVV